MLTSIAALTAACTTSDPIPDSGNTAPVFAVRDRSVDHAGELERLAAAIGWPHTADENRDNLTDRDGVQTQWGWNGPGDAGLSISTNNLDAWGFISAEHRADQGCDVTAPTSISEEQAVELARELWAATGLDTGRLDISTRLSTNSAGETTCVRVDGYLTVAGASTDLRFGASFGGIDGTLREANGFYVESVEIGELPLIAAADALAAEGEADPALAQTATLAYEAQRVVGVDGLFLVPVWSYPVANGLPSISAPAVRSDDLNDLIS